MGKTLTFLGSDAGYGEENNSAFIEHNGKLTIIDCGYTVFNKVKKIFDFSRFNYIEVIVTHLHNDHAGSLSQLILYAYFECNRKITVVSGCKNIKQYLNLCGTPDEAYEVLPKTNNIKMIKTQHTPYLDCYGFIIELDNKKIVYTGDTKTLEPFIKYLDGANELYVDVSKNGGAHIKIENIIEKLTNIKDSGVEVYLMHIDDKEFVRNIVNNQFTIV
ncbi:MAG: MBL fold metallo-hydrolase [Clostridia bacterium]|nr:MBL fold metallo-hydrolase [Clostridia bacterium]